jgi:Uma2 family endonuclease
MELSLDLNKRYTYADYSTWYDGVTRELIDGFIKIMSPKPKIKHQSVGLKLSSKFLWHIEKQNGKCGVYPDIDVLFTDGGDKNAATTVVSPDISIICDEEKIKDGIVCQGAPDMIVEIQSPRTARYDLTTKKDLYEKHGVGEYWVVFPDGGVEVFLLREDGKYDEGTYYEDTVETKIFPGCVIRISEIVK